MTLVSETLGSRGNFMADKFKGLEEGIKKVETQLYSMATKNTKRFEALESSQNQFSTQLKETVAMNQRLEMIISKLDTFKRAEVAAQIPHSPSSMASRLQGSLQIHESGQSSSSQAQITPQSTPSSYPVGRGFTFPPMFSS